MRSVRIEIRAYLVFRRSGYAAMGTPRTVFFLCRIVN